MSVWTPPQIPSLRGDESIGELREAYRDLANIVALAFKDMDFVINGNIDPKNMRVNSLSAITADIGKVTSGEIIGAYISTADGTYPRIDFSSAGDLLAAYSNANSYVALEPEESGAPAITIFEGGALQFILQKLSGKMLLLSGGTAQISSGGDLELFSGSSGYVIVSSWSKVQNQASGQTLQQSLDAKANAFTGFTGTFLTGDGKTATVSNGIITSVV